MLKTVSIEGEGSGRLDIALISDCDVECLWMPLKSMSGG